MRPFQCHAVIVATALLISLAAVSSRAQEPAPAPPPSADQTPPAPQPSTSPPISSSKHSHGHASDFLIIGSVFTDKAYALPGAHLRARRSTEKKFRWEAYTNSRGEFAIRVPQGSEYEMVIVAKGFADQNRAISAKSGISEDNVVFQMQPGAGGKK